MVFSSIHNRYYSYGVEQVASTTISMNYAECSLRVQRAPHVVWRGWARVGNDEFNLQSHRNHVQQLYNLQQPLLVESNTNKIYALRSTSLILFNTSRISDRYSSNINNLY